MEITGCKKTAFIAAINCLVLSAISMATVLHGGTCFVYLDGWCGALVKDLGLRPKKLLVLSQIEAIHKLSLSLALLQTNS